jgi:hypothetical protein
MTKAQALEKWSEAAAVDDSGVRVGNWEPIERAIRHCSGEGEEIEETTPGIVKVTVNKEGARGPFSLVVA